MSRKIFRTAFLQDYTGHPERLADITEEVAGKGYDMICINGSADINVFRMLCQKAVSLGLSVSAFTGYMKYDAKYLTEHPEQKIVTAKQYRDQDGLPAENWGCPFNAEFKQRYLDFLKDLASHDGVVRIMVNDEAYLPLGGCYCKTCRNTYYAYFKEELPYFMEPDIDLWQNIKWRKYLKWNIDRWNRVHGEMRDAIHSVNKEIAVIFQASPAVDLWRNPWSTSVDLSSMVEYLDGLSTDPYYTFHQVPFFAPKETYLSEWSRFIVGISGSEKKAEIIPQGFSHPTFNRPLDENDGIWSAIVPPACGVDIISPFTYTLQKCSPVQKAYEECFKLDEYFEKVEPVKYAGLVHSANTEIYYKPFPVNTPDSYDGTRVLPLAQSMRHSGIPYGYISDSGLNNKTDVSKYKVVILPEVACLSEAQEKNIEEMAKQGKKLIILGCLGISDEIGSIHGRDLLYKLTNINIINRKEKENIPGRFIPINDYGLCKNIQFSDLDTQSEHIRKASVPIFSLNDCVGALVPESAEVLAEFTDNEGNSIGKPAIVLAGKKRNILWFAGFPSHIAKNKKYNVLTRNLAHQLFGLFTQWLVGEEPELSVTGWPPQVPIKKVRPLDMRYMSTFEFFPLKGKEYYMGVVTSYFKEPTEFPMIFNIPTGKKLIQVSELLIGENIGFELKDNVATIDVRMDFNTPAKVFLFKLNDC